MKKIINYLKHLIRKFFPRPKIAEEYIVNTSQLYLNGEKMDGSKLYLDKGKVYSKFDE